MNCEILSKKVYGRLQMVLPHLIELRKILRLNIGKRLVPIRTTVFILSVTITTGRYLLRMFPWTF